MTLTKPQPQNLWFSGSSSSASMRLGSGLLLAFAVCFPLTTAFQRFASNHVKFWALAAFAVILGVVLVKHYQLRLGFWKDTREVRFAALIWLILNCYACVLLGVSAASLLLLITSFLLLQLLVRQQTLEGKLPPRVSQLLRILTLVTVLCCFVTTNQFTGLAGSEYRQTGLVTFICCVLIFIATVRFIPKAIDVERVIQWLLNATFVVSAVGLLQFLGQKGFMAGIFSDLRVDPRSMGTFGHPNWFGTYLLLVFPLAVYKFFREGGSWWGALCCLIHANLVTAQTRGAWIAGVAFLAMLVILQPVYRRRTLRLLMMLGLVTAILLPMQDWQVLKRADTLPGEASKAVQGALYAGSGRLGFWKYALQVLPQHAVLGSGLDTLAEVAPPGVTPPVDKAHSIYLEYAVTLGIPGLILYLMFLLRCVAGKPRCFLQWTFRTAILCYFVQGLFIHDTVHTWPLVWFIAGLAVVAARDESVPNVPETGTDTLSPTLMPELKTS